MEIVVLFSDANFIATNLLENLLTKNCFVNIVTDDTRNWREKTSYIANKSRFSIVDTKNFTGQNFSYSIILTGFINGEPYQKINNIFNNNNFQKSKNLIVIPFEKYSFEKNSELIVPENIGVIYTGDVVGPRMDLNSDLLISQLINSIYYKRRIRLGVGEVLYPVFVSDVVKLINKWLLSFGPYGQESLLLGPQTSGSDFWKINSELIHDIKIDYDEKIAVRKTPRGLEIKNIECDLKLALTETYKWMGDNMQKVQTKVYKPKLKNDKPKRKYPKYLKPLILTILVIFALPLLMLIISSGLLFISYKEFINKNDKGAQNTLLLSKTFSVISKGESGILSYIPILGRIYKETNFISEVFERGADIGVSAIPVLRISSDLTNKVFGNIIYNPTGESENLKSGLDDIYRNISLLQADTNSAVSSHLVSAEFLQNKIDIEKIKNLTQYGSNIAGGLPDILGKGQTKTYFLLFQNNMELRPTGGFIGSFGLLTFDNGRITDLAVNDVYSADGQLNGHVEPPSPIKQYLGEANWWLRDSNWDPDFPTSAKRAEWFLDKEMGKSVDGVISIDLDFVKNILKSTGPVFLPDFNLEITSDNLYEKTQAEVQDDFFPGSRKKASFLTALSRSLLNEVSKLNSSQKMNILRSFYSDLDERHIQVFFHNETMQDSIAKLSWDGAVSIPSCGEACYADFVGDVEANVGVNKANYFIDRTQDLSVHIDNKSIERTLNINLKNKSNPALGLAGKYKVYLRTLIPDDSDIVSVKLYTGDAADTVSPDITEIKGRKEVGFLVEVLGSQSKKIEVKWKTNFSKNEIYAKYGVFIRKQSGVADDPFSLTINGRKVYNSNLADDYFARFTLK